jgi:hypothetical protein
VELACPFCGGKARLYRTARRWKIKVWHGRDCPTRTTPAYLWRANGWLIQAALPDYAGEDEVEIKHRAG